MTKTENPDAFKHMFDRDAVAVLAQRLAGASTSFDTESFVATATDGLLELELKDRVRHITAALREHLPDDYPAALRVILDALPPADASTDDVTSGFLLWPFCHFVQTEGLENPELSLDAMHALTQRFSAEFAIRPYLLRHPELTLDRLHGWTADPNPHVRRLVSEGTRPRLPWGTQLKPFIDDPAPLLPLLEALRHDDEEYVRRSVANNLNDIAKDHPDLVAEIARRWSTDASDDEQRMIRHALRTLVKKGHRGALAVLGYGEVEVDVTSFDASPGTISIGESVTLSASISTTRGAAQALLIDYAVHHQRANGSTSAKVFKWTKRQLDADGELNLEKRHSMRVVTTRAYYPGTHVVELLVNGVVTASTSFELT